jgi:hypothetical protein
MAVRAFVEEASIDTAISSSNISLTLFPPFEYQCVSFKKGRMTWSLNSLL